MKASTQFISTVIVITIALVIMFGFAHTTDDHNSTEVVDMDGGSIDRSIIQEDGVVCYTFEDDNQNDPEYSMSCLPINQTDISR